MPSTAKESDACHNSAESGTRESTLASGRPVKLIERLVSLVNRRVKVFLIPDQEGMP
jgi:hypothetical protein